jgi:hypothetical protein
MMAVEEDNNKTGTMRVDGLTSRKGDGKRFLLTIKRKAASMKENVFNLFLMTA